MTAWQWIEILDCIDAVAALVVLRLYFRVFVSGALGGNMAPVDWLIGGICLTWLGTFIDRAWRLSWHVFARPVWMLDSSVLMFSLVIVALGGVMHIAAKNEHGAGLWTGSWRIFAFVITAGVVLGGFMIWLTGRDFGNLMH